VNHGIRSQPSQPGQASQSRSSPRGQAITKIKLSRRCRQFPLKRSLQKPGAGSQDSGGPQDQEEKRRSWCWQCFNSEAVALTARKSSGNAWLPTENRDKRGGVLALTNVWHKSCPGIISQSVCLWALGLRSHIMLQFPLAGNLININNASHVAHNCREGLAASAIKSNRW